MYGYFSGALIAQHGESWDPAVLDQLAEINERILEVLAEAGGQQRPYDSALGLMLAAQWRSLDAAARSRLAASPYLLLDCRFASPELWSVPLHASVRDGAGAGYRFASALGAPTLRHVMQLAWHWSRANPVTAQIALGLSPPCARLIASKRLRELEAMADLCPDWIRPRWEARPEVWRQLLSAAVPIRPAALRQLHLRGLQLLAASGTGREAQATFQTTRADAWSLSAGTR